MTLLGPILMALFYGAIIYLAISDLKDYKLRHIQVLDESGVFKDGIPATESLNFDVNLYKTEGVEYYGSLIVPKDFSIDQPNGIQFLSPNSLSLSEQNAIETQIESVIREQKLNRSGIRKETLDSLKTKVHIKSAKVDGDVLVENNSAVNAGAGFIAAFMIYLFIFLYGVQVMKGVAEEKSNRIVEVIISSVRPFDLMMGKIVGIALVGLTQLFIWIVLGFGLITLITPMVAGMGPEVTTAASNIGSAGAMSGMENPALGGILGGIFQLNFGTLLLSFLFYFLSGYLLYAALFAAIAAAVDSETDTQQFMMPITLPLIFSIVVAQTSVINDPSGSLATWLSMIPFTSPIVMMVRIPFGVETWQLLLSMVLMIFGFVGTTWLASRIYRVGILMYGKKPTYRELFKWLTYKG